MKKLFTVTLLAGLLSIPSVVLAEATWYGSMRAVAVGGGGEDGRMWDGFSKWGIKGSAEASEGLTAVYNFEHKIDTTNAGMPGGRLAYVGLSGGFGTITAGQLWSASSNTVGFTDQAPYNGSNEASGRTGNTLSYAVSAGAMSLQVDLMADGGSDTGGAIDSSEFGISFDLGDFGKLGFAHTNKKDTKKIGVITEAIDAVAEVTQWQTQTGMGDTAMVIVVDPIMVTVANANIADHIADGILTEAGLNALTATNGNYATGDITGCEDANTDNVADNECEMVTAYVQREDTPVRTNGSDNTNVVTHRVTETYHAEAAEEVITPEVEAEDAVMGSVLDKRGHKTSHLAYQINMGGITGHVGFSQKKMNGAEKKSKTTHFGISGSLGDTGVSFVAQGRNKKAADGTKTTPWVIGVGRSLGGGASVHFEHANNDDDKSGITSLGLHVNF